MLSPIQQSKVKTIVDSKIVSQEEFTAYDITKAVRISEFVMHADVRDYVHILMEDYIQLGEYSRNIEQRTGWISPAMVYSSLATKVDDDSDIQVITTTNTNQSFLPLTQNDTKYIGHEFESLTKSRVSLPIDLFGDSSLSEIFVYDGNANEQLVVSTIPQLGYTRKINRDGNKFRFSLNPYIEACDLDFTPDSMLVNRIEKTTNNTTVYFDPQ